MRCRNMICSHESGLLQIAVPQGRPQVRQFRRASKQTAGIAQAAELWTLPYTEDRVGAADEITLDQGWGRAAQSPAYTPQDTSQE